MTESDLENFVELESHNRMESLKEIRMIVCGIVLFNKDTGIGNTMDENIPDCKFGAQKCKILVDCHFLVDVVAVFFSDENFAEIFRFH